MCYYHKSQWYSVILLKLQAFLLRKETIDVTTATLLNVDQLVA